MAIWADAPRAEGTLPNYSILRTPTTMRLTMHVLSDKYEGVRLHYWRGRSLPCNTDACEACEHGQIPRWKGYILAKAIRTEKIVIFEFTERCWEAMNEAYRKWGSLRGAVIHAERLGRKNNSPMQLTVDDARTDESLLPPPVDLRSMLTRIWEVRQKTFESAADTITTNNNKNEEDYA